MGEIIPFKKPKAASKTLCKSGFHRFRLESESRFDVKQGRLVTVYRCERCGVTKNELR
ncbi:MAG: hypothetical protein PHE55_10190 [Methylococcaceae bacterium]|nr:hypothetical protein [Methylococcaceae bacterium]